MRHYHRIINYTCSLKQSIFNIRSVVVLVTLQVIASAYAPAACAKSARSSIPSVLGIVATLQPRAHVKKAMLDATAYSGEKRALFFVMNTRFIIILLANQNYCIIDTNDEANWMGGYIRILDD
jgi:hypothetical protein